MKVRMLAGARAGQEQDVPVPVARSLVSDGRAEYVDAWRNEGLRPADAPPAPVVHTTPSKKHGASRGRR